MRPWNQLWLATATAMAVLLGGCFGSPDDPAIASQSNVLTDATPLPLIARAAWKEAPAGCEGLVEPDVQLGVAEGAPSLVGVLDTSGDVSCVDSFDAVEEDLVGMGAGTTAERIRESYQLTRPHTLMESASGGKTAGDPSPQPNSESSGDAMDEASLFDGLVYVDDTSSDPSPQPNDEGPAEGDPSPQPN